MADQTPSPAWAPPCEVRTERLVVRAYVPDDVGPLHDAVLASYVALRAHVAWAHREPESLDDRRARVERYSRAFAAGEELPYGIFDRETGAFLGGTALHPAEAPRAFETGYWLIGGARGRGLASEAVAALTFVALENQGAARVEIRCDPANAKSAAVPRRLGFTDEGVLPGNDAYAELEGRTGTQVWAADAGTLARLPLAGWPRPEFGDAGSRTHK